MNSCNPGTMRSFALRGRLVCIVAFFLFCASSIQSQILTNVFTRVLLLQAGDMSGSSFTIDVDGRQYIVTAKHVVSRLKDNDLIRVRRPDGWTSVRVKVLRCDDPVDIAVLIPDKQLTLNFPVEPSMIGMQVGQDTYFLGFPYGQVLSDVKYEKVGEHISIPFIKKATWSASSRVGDGSLLFLDGHNNPGFSGGPIVFRDFNQQGYVMKVAGVVSGYTPDFEYVLDPKKVIPGEDLSHVEPWRIVKIRGEKFRLVDTQHTTIS